MKLLKVLALLVCLSPLNAWAGNIDDMVGLGMKPEWAVLLDDIFNDSIQETVLPGTDDTYDLGSASKQFQDAFFSDTVTLGTGGIVSLTATGQVKWGAAPVITPATTYPTPSAGNTLSSRRTILAAGAPTLAAVVLPLPTVAIGRSFTLFNQGSNPALIAPNTGAVINVDAALTPFSCATLKECECTNTLAAGTSWWCTAK